VVDAVEAVLNVEFAAVEAAIGVIEAVDAIVDVVLEKVEVEACWGLAGGRDVTGAIEA
jgi:hypothetical protein